MNIDSLLQGVTKPGRYIGLEPGSIRPDPEARLRWVLAFPDVYDIGTSHLGMQILYSLLNRLENVSCERAFAPWLDFEQQLREREVPLASMETRCSLRDFDLLGFTLQHEMLYTNVLNMLDLAGIPIRSSERTPEDPIVLAGGPCAVNPEPLSDFIDAFCIGDGEEMVADISKVLLECKTNGLDRAGSIEALAKIPGVYVPRFYRPQWKDNGQFGYFLEESPQIPRRIRAQKIRLRGAFYPTRQIVPLIDSVHDRISVEIRRGCTRGCRFCQAGMIARPVRERDVDEIIRLSEESVDRSGFDEVSLMSLSSGDYSQIGPLLKGLKPALAAKNCMMAVPSIRLDRCPDEFWSGMSDVKQRGVTFAPEAGSERLRKAINKDLTNEEIFETVRRSFQQGLKVVKLYFMIGLPTETMEDLQATVDLVQELRGMMRAGKGKKSLHVSIAPFVPKPHTPFQWFGQNTKETFREKVAFLSENLRSRDVKVQWHDLDRSFLEAVFTRGDRRLGSVIERAWCSGAKMDDWTDCFDANIWDKAFQDSGIDPSWYANRERDEDESFPWDFIDTGVKKEFLLKEYQKAVLAEQTPDCFIGTCRGCGACGESIRIERASQPAEGEGVDPTGEPDRKEKDGPQQELPYWYRIEFHKPERVRFLSHLDIQRIFLQTLHRSKLPVRMTQGFHPHPKISFGMASPTGVESLAEFVDVALNEPVDESEILGRLSESAGEVLRFQKVKGLGRHRDSLVQLSKRIVYEVSLESGNQDQIESLVEELERVSNESTATDDTVPLDIVSMIDMIYRLPGEDRAVFRLSVRVDDGRTPKVRDMLAWMGSLVEDIGPIVCSKVSVLGETAGGDLVSLIDL